MFALRTDFKTPADVVWHRQINWDSADVLYANYNSNLAVLEHGEFTFKPKLTHTCPNNHLQIWFKETYTNSSQGSFCPSLSIFSLCCIPSVSSPPSHLCVYQVFYVSDLFKPRVKPATPPPSPIKKELLPSSDIIERNNHHNMVWERPQLFLWLRSQSQRCSPPIGQ